MWDQIQLACLALAESRVGIYAWILGVFIVILYVVSVDRFQGLLVMKDN